MNIRYLEIKRPGLKSYRFDPGIMGKVSKRNYRLPLVRVLQKTNTNNTFTRYLRSTIVTIV